MSNPLITLPALDALKIAKLLRFVDDRLFPGRAPEYRALYERLKSHLAEQLSEDELTTIFVALQLEDANASASNEDCNP